MDFRVQLDSLSLLTRFTAVIIDGGDVVDFILVLAGGIARLVAFVMVLDQATRVDVQELGHVLIRDLAQESQCVDIVLEGGRVSESDLALTIFTNLLGVGLAFVGNESQMR